jgi:hypothetical protein
VSETARLERRLFRLNDELRRLRREQELVEGELGMHRHLADDATRDAVVSEHPVDQGEARASARDVARLQAALDDVRRKIDRVQAHREDLLARLRDSP